RARDHPPPPPARALPRGDPRRARRRRPRRGRPPRARHLRGARGAHRPRTRLPDARPARRPDPGRRAPLASQRADSLAPSEEPALERAEDLAAHEGLRVCRPPLVARHAHVVLERLVGALERVLQLEALEEVVVRPRLVAAAVLRIDRPADSPEPAGLPLDPDDDALLDPEVVDTRDDPLREPALLRGPSHHQEDTIAPMARLSSFFRGLFSFLGTHTAAEDRVAAYVMREH